MALKYAYSTIACPEWSIEQVADRAKEYGYDGIELRTLGTGSSHIASDPALSDSSRITKAVAAAGIEIACLSSSQCLHYRDETKAKEAIWAIREEVKLAADLGCTRLRVFGNEVLPGENRRSVIQRIANHVLPISQEAAKQGVEIVFENAGSFAVAKDWWTIFNQMEFPFVGVLWNVANAAASGEGPAVSVPMLNSRIKMTKVKDTLIGEGVGYLPLGEGNVEIQHFIKRLLGIGYDGYVSVEWDRLWQPDFAPIPADEYLPQSIETLKTWTTEIQELNSEADKKAEKAAAKSAPQPRLRAS